MNTLILVVFFHAVVNFCLGVYHHVVATLAKVALVEQLLKQKVSAVENTVVSDVAKVESNVVDTAYTFVNSAESTVLHDVQSVEHIVASLITKAVLWLKSHTYKS